jgi:hypothetical protein
MLACPSFIASLVEINGISIEEIERRAKPLVDKTEDPLTWRCRSSCGFLGEHESFKDNLLTSFAQLQSLGTSNEELVFHLKAIIRRAEERRSDLKVGPSAPISITYSPYPLNGANEFDCHEYVVEKILFMGSQQSLFYNPERKDAEWSEWKNDYKITNVKSNVSLNIAGNADCGIISYIEKYGFYEGGNSNDYKLTPRSIVSVLLGQ